MFDLQQQTLPYTGDPSVQAIAAQFHDTPIADVFADIAEGKDITAVQLHDLLDNQLNGHRQLVKLKKQKALFRLVNMWIWGSYGPGLYLQFNVPGAFMMPGWVDDITPNVRAVAQPLRETIAQLVPAVQGTDLNDIEVNLTPVVKSNQQLILYEYRQQRELAQPGKSTHVYTRVEEQYTVFEQDEEEQWQQRGVLAFLTRNEFADDPDILSDQRIDAVWAEEDALQAHIAALQAADPERALEIHNSYQDQIDAFEDREMLAFNTDPEPLERKTRVETHPYDSVLFTLQATEQEASTSYRTIAYRTIYAALPEDLAFDFPSREDET